jgi:hypothetical protein
MERKDEQEKPGKDQPTTPQSDESMAQPRERDKGKREDEKDPTVGKVPDPQGEEEQRDRGAA